MSFLNPLDPMGLINAAIISCRGKLLDWDIFRVFQRLVLWSWPCVGSDQVTLSVPKFLLRGHVYIQQYNHTQPVQLRQSQSH